MDNRVFNVNGRGLAGLEAAIALALAQEDGFFDSTPSKDPKIKAYRVSNDKGLILYKYVPSNREGQVQVFLTPLNAKQIAPMVIGWLEQQFKEQTRFPGAESHWDTDLDHDGSNSEGWRLYVEDWGHVDNDWGVVCAIVPAFMWHGK